MTADLKAEVAALTATVTERAKYTDASLQRLTEKIDEVLEHVKRTNGRVTELETENKVQMAVFKAHRWWVFGIASLVASGFSLLFQFAAPLAKNTPTVQTNIVTEPKR